jgi:hypothetical protein
MKPTILFLLTVSAVVSILSIERHRRQSQSARVCARLDACIKERRSRSGASAFSGKGEL